MKKLKAKSNVDIELIYDFQHMKPLLKVICKDLTFNCIYISPESFESLLDLVDTQEKEL